METVLRALAIYFFLMVVFRIMGKRSFHQTTTFDFVLLLIVAETVQQAMITDDSSLTGACVLVATLATTDIGLSLLKRRWPRLDRLIDEVPVLIVQDGKLLTERIAKERVDAGDIAAAARLLRGLERLDQVKYAVIERDGSISIVPR